MEVHHRYRLPHSLVSELLPKTGAEVVTRAISERHGKKTMTGSDEAAADQVVGPHREHFRLTATWRRQHKEVSRGALYRRELCPDWSIGRHRLVALQNELHKT